LDKGNKSPDEGGKLKINRRGESQGELVGVGNGASLQRIRRGGKTPPKPRKRSRVRKHKKRQYLDQESSGHPSARTGRDPLKKEAHHRALQGRRFKITGIRKGADHHQLDRKKKATSLGGKKERVYSGT